MKRPRFTRRPWTRWLGILLLAAAWACEEDAPPGPDVVASMNGEELRYSDFEQFLHADLGDAAAVALASEVLTALFDRFLEEELMVREAARLELVGRSAAPREAAEALLAGVLEPREDDQAVRRFYEENAERFRVDERVELRQILVADRAQAEQAHREIQEGRSFLEVAKEVSQQLGGEAHEIQGNLSRRDLPAEFSEIVFGLQPGGISPVVQADYGFHVFQVVSRHPERHVSLEEAAPEIVRELVRRRGDAELRRVVGEAAERYNLRVHERNLPFQYTGRYRTTPGR